MNEEIKNTDKSEGELKQPDLKKTAPVARSKRRKKKSSLIRVTVMVLLLCVAIFGAVIVTDLVSGNNSGDDTSGAEEKITVTISGDSIYIDGDNRVSIDELRERLKKESEDGELPVICIINDTKNPADYVMYNQVAELLEDFDVHIERMQPPSTEDEAKFSTKDEINY